MADKTEKTSEKISALERSRKKTALYLEKYQLEKAKARLLERKERNGQLIAFGVYIEEFFKGEPDSARERLEESIKKYLTGRNLTRALEGLKRLAKEIEEKKEQEKESGVAPKTPEEHFFVPTKSEF